MKSLNHKSYRFFVTLIAGALFSLTASAFQVLPKVSDVDRKISRLGSNPVLDYVGHWFVDSAIPYMKSPVHEAITLTALGCAAQRGDEMECVTISNVDEHRVILYGVRWPDDPPFRLNPSDPPRIKGCDTKVTLRSTAQPRCWLGLFEDAGKKAKLKSGSNEAAFGPGDYLLYRSHYGDLQFMHAMGTYDGEPAGLTFERMKMWAEFLWGVAIKVTPTGTFIRDLGMGQLSNYFPGDMTATNLFATGIVEVRKDLDKVAIGALLHMVQDSFSEAHATRGFESGARCPQSEYAQPGQIERFHSYAHQSTDLHDHEDKPDALHLHTMQVEPSVVDVSHAFISMWRQQKSWSEVEPFFDCVFHPKDLSTPANAGRFIFVEKAPTPIYSWDPR